MSSSTGTLWFLCICVCYIQIQNWFTVLLTVVIYRFVYLTAAMEGFFPSPAGGWVTSEPKKITGCWKTNGLDRTNSKCVPNTTNQEWNKIERKNYRMQKCFHICDSSSISTHLPCGRRMLLTPPNLTLIFRQRLERVWGVVFWTFFTCTHCVAIPSTVSPTRFTSAIIRRTKNIKLTELDWGQKKKTVSKS